jgi:hypothetical protein
MYVAGIVVASVGGATALVGVGWLVHGAVTAGLCTDSAGGLDPCEDAGGTGKRGGTAMLVAGGVTALAVGLPLAIVGKRVHDAPGASIDLTLGPGSAQLTGAF